MASLEPTISTVARTSALLHVRTIYGGIRVLRPFTDQCFECMVDLAWPTFTAWYCITPVPLEPEGRYTGIF
jgi:hypothetical protein